MVADVSEMSYRDALERVEEIIRAMDRVDISVDELAPLVEEASTLLTHCRGVLETTSIRVEGALKRLSSDDPEDSE